MCDAVFVGHSKLISRWEKFWQGEDGAWTLTTRRLLPAGELRLLLQGWVC